MGSFSLDPLKEEREEKSPSPSCLCLPDRLTDLLYFRILLASYWQEEEDGQAKGGGQMEDEIGRQQSSTISSVQITIC